MPSVVFGRESLAFGIPRYALWFIEVTVAVVIVLDRRKAAGHEMASRSAPLLSLIRAR